MLILSVYKLILSGSLKINITEKTLELWFVTLKDLVEPRIVFSKHPSDYYTSNLPEKQTKQLILLCVPNRNSYGPRDSRKETEVYRMCLGFENSFGFLSCVSLRSQFLKFDI